MGNAERDRGRPHPDGLHLIVRHNDWPAFPTGTISPGRTTLSVSGIAMSNDGGASLDGLGTLPPGAQGEWCGEPDVKHDLTRDVFFYSSIYRHPGGRRAGRLHRGYFTSGSHLRQLAKPDSGGNIVRVRERGRQTLH